jgi:hypothetical protein
MLVGLALDGQSLMLILHHALPGWVLAPLLAAHLGLGLAAGVLYFRSVRRTACLLADGGSLGSAVCLGAGRFAALGIALFLAAREGAAPLLCMAAGVLLARFAMVRLPPASAA